MNFTDDRVTRYLLDQQPSTHPVLVEMERRAAKEGFPIIGPLVGRTCAILAQAIGARRVYEMGSGFGYSTLHFALALGPGSHIVHTDGDPGLSEDAKAYHGRTGPGVAQHGASIEYHVGNALTLLAKDKGTYDVVFIDVDKHQYPEAARIAMQKLRVGGLMLIDNTLWSGKVAEPRITDRDTEGVRALNRLLVESPDFRSTILPLRDGLTVALRVR